MCFLFVKLHSHLKYTYSKKVEILIEKEKLTFWWSMGEENGENPDGVRSIASTLPDSEIISFRFISKSNRIETLALVWRRQFLKMFQVSELNVFWRCTYFSWNRICWPARMTSHRGVSARWQEWIFFWKMFSRVRYALLCYALLPIHFDEVANLCCCKLTISVDATFVGSLVEMKMKKMMLLLFSFRGREEETRPRAKDLLLFSAALVVLQFLTKTRSFDFERCTGWEEEKKIRFWFSGLKWKRGVRISEIARTLYFFVFNFTLHTFDNVMTFLTTPPPPSSVSTWKYLRFLIWYRNYILIRIELQHANLVLCNYSSETLKEIFPINVCFNSFTTSTILSK